MADIRDPATITEELSDLRRYINGLSTQLIDTGAFVAYQKREELLHEELIAATLYRVVGEPKERFEPFAGLKSQMATIVGKLSEFQESLRRRSMIGRVFANTLPLLAVLGSMGASFFITQSSDTFALISSCVTILVTCLYSQLALRERLVEHRLLSRELETMKWRLEEYVELDKSSGPNGKLQRELLLALVKQMAETKAEQLAKP